MKPIRILTLALVCALCSLSVPPAHAQIGTTCTITGTIWQVDGVTPAAGASLTVTRADKAGKLYANTSRVYSTNSNGIVSFKVPRTIGTDTAVIHVKASFGNLASGQILYVPSDSTATLESLVRYTANPTFVVVAVPSGGGSGDTSLNGHPRLTRIENVEGQFTASTSDSLQQTAASVFVARNVAEGKADADSVKLAFDRLGDRADADSLAGVKTTADGAFQRADTNALHAQKFKVIDNRFGDRADADSLASVKSTADAALPKADTTALHAQKFALINDSLLSVSLRATSTANDLTAHAGTADAHLPSQTGASGKFLQSNGTVSSWQTALTAETDPTAIPRTDSTRFVSRTAPQIPGLASSDTNTVIGVDASGNLVLRKDDAGTGGASIDSNRIVRTDIKAPKVAATVGGFDSTATSFTLIDTLRWVKYDSVSYRRVGASAPSTLHPYAHRRVGYVDFEVLCAPTGHAGAGITDYTLFADTANSVAIIQIETQIYALENSGTDTEGIRGQAAYVFGIRRQGVGDTRTIYAANISQYLVAPGADMKKRLIVRHTSGLYPAAGSPFFFTRLRVHYSIPASTSSTFYVGLIEE